MTPFYSRIEIASDVCQSDKCTMIVSEDEEYCSSCGMKKQVLEHNNKKIEFIRRYEEWREDER